MQPGGMIEGVRRPPTAPTLRRIEVLVNASAGHVGPGAAAAAEEVISGFGLACQVRTPAPDDLMRELKAAVDSGPDLLVVLAGDGTARAAANLCGAKGPLLAPLAGGTMNMLPHALYGPKDWKTALAETLSGGVPTPVSGGEVDGRRFYVAAILGAPALWAEAREAARHQQLILAVRKARNALRRAFSRRLRYSLDGGPPVHALALTLMCPLVSRAMVAEDDALEAAALDPQGIADALRLGARTLLGRMVGDWRQDPVVNMARCRAGSAWTSGHHLHAILDGEPARLHKHAEIRFLPKAFRALVPPPPPVPLAPAP